MSELIKKKPIEYGFTSCIQIAHSFDKFVSYCCYCRFNCCCCRNQMVLCVQGIVFLPLTKFSSFLDENPEKSKIIKVAQSQRTQHVSMNKTVNVNNDHVCVSAKICSRFQVVATIHNTHTLHTHFIFLSSLEQKFVYEAKCIAWQFAALYRKNVGDNSKINTSQSVFYWINRFCIW